jgi:hypothetical protein
MRKSFPFFVLLTLMACKQSPNDKLKPEIKNEKTADHINVPGTRVYMIPPKGFIVSKTFIGLQKGEDAMFSIYDVVGGNFKTNTATFSRSAFEQKGATVFDYQEINVNGFPAKYILMQGEATIKAVNLVFGDSTFSTMIMAVYPADDDATGDEIVKSLNTIWYDKERKIDPFETAYFSLDDHASKFKFFQYNANIYIYAVNGIDPKGDKDAPVVIVTQIPKDNTTTVQGVAEMMFGKAQQYGFTDTQVKNPSNEKVNNYDAYQAEVYGQMQGKNSLLYYCVVAKGDKTVVVQGIAKVDIKSNLEEFKKLAHSVSVK